MNWYRVLSPLIDETLRRGHSVECWHNSGATGLGENCPNKEKIPNFGSGVPIVVEYLKAEDIILLVRERCPDVIIDLHPPNFSEISQIKRDRGGRPYWLLVDLPPCDCLLAIQSDENLYGCDAFAVCNDFYFQSSVGYIGQNKKQLLASCRAQERVLGKMAIKAISDTFMYQFGEKQTQYLKEHSLVVGNAGFDEYVNIDRKSVRQKHGIPEDKRIVVLLPCPFGYDQTAPWEQLYVRSSLFRRLLWVVSANRFDCLWRSFFSISNKAVLVALRKFSDANNALLVAKVRHSRRPAPELNRYCHLLIGEEGMYPHTAAELFAVADLVVGHYSFGAIEAIALGTPYLNVEIPGFPKKFYCDTRTSLHNCDPWPGAVWSMEAAEVINDLPLKVLEKFRLIEKERKKYLEKFATWPFGGASAQILAFLENQEVLEKG